MQVAVSTMNNLSTLTWHILPDSASLARDASQRIFRQARHAIGDRGSFKVVLAGGNTPLHTYRYLSRGESDWNHWHVFFGDERCVAASDPVRNSQMISKSFLRDVAIPDAQVHLLHADAGFDVAISDYEKKIRGARPFDLVLLGMGEDGHTASLFPGQEYDELDEVVAVHNAPKEPAERVSLNYPTLNDSRKVMILIEGESKQSAVKAWLGGVDLPISRITGLNGVDVLIDQSAYPG